MKIHKIHNLNEYKNSYRNRIFSFVEHVKILSAYTIRDYYRNHDNFKMSSSNTIGYYDNMGRKKSFIQTMRYAGNFQNPMNECPRKNYKSLSYIIKEYYE